MASSAEDDDEKSVVQKFSYCTDQPSQCAGTIAAIVAAVAIIIGGYIWYRLRKSKKRKAEEKKKAQQAHEAEIEDKVAEAVEYAHSTRQQKVLELLTGIEGSSGAGSKLGKGARAAKMGVQGYSAYKDLREK